jgi:hypothetical protein
MVQRRDASLLRKMHTCAEEKEKKEKEKEKDKRASQTGV